MKKRVKKLLAMATILALTVASMSVASFAAVSVDTVEKLENALKNKETEIALDAALTFDKEVKLEAEVPTTITVADTAVDAFTATKNGKLTLGKNLKIISNVGAVLYAEQGGIINVDGAVIDCTVAKYTVGTAWTGGVINVLSGSVTGKGNNKVTLSAKHDGSQINIKGGAVVSTHSSTVVAKEGADATISGGTVKTTCENPAFCAIHVNGEGSSVVVTGGTVIAVAGQAIVPEAKASASISAGDFSGGKEKGAVYTHNDGSTLIITGGTFNSDVSEFFDKNKYEMNENNQVVEKHVHDWKDVAAKAATCKDDGYVAHKYCEGCKGYLVGEKEVKAEDIVVKATGQHDYQNGVCSVCNDADPNYVAPDADADKDPVVEDEEDPVVEDDEEEEPAVEDEEEPADEEDEEEAPETGDATQVALWIGLLMAACVGFAAVRRGEAK